ncbi:MAG TPA: hypothetical protein PLS49_02455, partial [Candidatus Woesebacteria bacterium]|nr:hypothetical protein [Candidatus Woesebacteria bacterium]
MIGHIKQIDIRWKIAISIILFFVLILSFIIRNKSVFTPVGDNITYLIGAESLYYDKDIKIQQKDFKRLFITYKEVPENIPIIVKPDGQGDYFVAKPIFYMGYLALFTFITDPLLRAIISNILILIILLYVSISILLFYYKKHTTVIALVMLVGFLVAITTSQLPFYISVFHPELFFNMLVLLSTI